MVGFGIASIILISGLYLFFILKNSSSIGARPLEKIHIEKEKREVDTSSFTDDEKRVYELLGQSNGSMYQGDIVKETGLSKVKVTRILDKLEHDDNILERKRRGMTNLVVLK